MGWHRFHTPPRRAFRGATLTKLTPRGQWLYDRSLARYNATPDGIEMARLGRTSIVTGEIGTIESLRFIMPKTLPEPAGMGSAQEISMRADVASELLDERNRLHEQSVMSANRIAELERELEEARKVRTAAENLIKVKGRHHTEIAYQRLISAIDAVRQQERDASASPLRSRK